jgi:hypothetical protein
MRADLKLVTAALGPRSQLLDDYGVAWFGGVFD